jgi:hyperosmotically inducible periplasmic protein
MKKEIKLLTCIAISLSLAGCAAALIGGGAAAGGYAVAKDKGPVGQYTEDSVITSKIKTKFLADIHLKSYNISVSTNNRIVTLTGTVPNEGMKRLAIHTAQSTKGVKAVNVTNFTVSQ